MIRKSFVMAAVMSLVLAYAGKARADVITYEADFSTGGLTAGNVAGSFSVRLLGLDIVSLPRFNGPGTLQQVEISIQSSYYREIAGYAFDNRGEWDLLPIPPFVFNERNDAAVDLKLDGTLQVSLFDPASSTGTFNLPRAQTGCSASISESDPVACGAQTFRSLDAWNATLPTGSFALSSFVGADAINLSFLMDGLFSGSCDSDDLADSCYGGAGLAWFGNARVRYTYAPDDGGGEPTPVPEPATITLLGVGLIALGAKCRRHHG